MRKATLVVALLAAACGGAAQKPGHFPGPPSATKQSTAKDRQAVSITVYNQNFGLVREVRDVGVGEGKISLELRDVAAHIQPATVHIKSLDDPAALSVLEQNYRYDLLSPQKLLEKYVDKKVKVIRWNEKEGRDEEKEAEVLAVQQGTVLRMGNEVTFGVPGRMAFPEVPANLISKPTLVWLLESTRPKQKIEVTYLTQNIGWHADYVLALDEADAKGDLVGWVTLDNQSGTAYENAQLKLVAGDVQKLARDEAPPEEPRAYEREKDSGGERFKEESFFEYHLYSLQRPTNLLEKEQKQVSLLEAENIALQKKLIFWGAAYYYRGNYGQVVSNQKVGVYLDFENTEKNHMGMPLPKGIVRVYKADKSGARQFIGEDKIDHTPRDEKIRIKMGEAFDVVGDRKQMDWKSISGCVSESTWEIHLRNHKDVAQAVELYEPADGDWEILQSSHKYEKKDAHTFTFNPLVPARGEVKVTYRVRIKWC